MARTPTENQVRLARTLAVVADAAQLLLAPGLLIPGGGWAVADVLDLAVAAAMVYLVGWHWSFLPTFVAEGIPLLNVVPTWTASVWLATRKMGKQQAPPPEEKIAGSGSTLPGRG